MTLVRNIAGRIYLSFVFFFVYYFQYLQASVLHVAEYKPIT